MESLGFVDLGPPSVALETAQATVMLKPSAGTSSVDCYSMSLHFLTKHFSQYAPPENKTCPLNVWCVPRLCAALLTTAEALRSCSQYGFCGQTSDFCETGW
jgi:hypothetical protein